MTPCALIRHTARSGVLLCLGAAALLAKATGAEEAPGDVMTSEEMRAYHYGQELSGCYPGQREDEGWVERMAEDGSLYDLEKGGRRVGTWWVQDGGVICFTYNDRPPGPYCFTGRRRGRYHDFYSTETGELTTTTQCEDEPIAFRRNDVKRG